MPDFILVPSRVPDAIRRMQDVREFRVSAEFRALDAEERSMPGVVTAAFFHLATSSDTPANVASRMLRVLDELAAWNARDVDDLFISEGIMVVDQADLDRVRPSLGANLVRLLVDYEDNWADDVYRKEPVETSELITWMEDDWLEILFLAEDGGLSQRPVDQVVQFVIDSVEPGLRQGQLRLGHVYAAGFPERFDPIDRPVDELLDLIREALSRRDLDPIEIDLWLDTVPDRPA